MRRLIAPIALALLAGCVSGPDRSGQDLAGASLAGERLVRASFRGSNLQKADLSGADLSLADLTGADLREANLRRARLRSATLDGARLDGADLRGADLEGASLKNAILDGARLGPDEGRITNLARARLVGAKMVGADLEGANLSGAYLRDADLTDATLRSATLSGTRFPGATLRGADLREARLDSQGWASLRTADLQDAKLPEGFEAPARHATESPAAPPQQSGDPLATLAAWGDDFFAALKSGDRDRARHFVMNDADCRRLLPESDAAAMAQGIRISFEAALTRAMREHPDIAAGKFKGFRHPQPERMQAGDEGLVIDAVAVWETEIVYEVNGEERVFPVFNLMEVDGTWKITQLLPP